MITNATAKISFRDDDARAALSAALAGAYPDNYGGFMEQGGIVTIYFSAVPDDLATTLSPFVTSDTEKQLLAALQVLQSDPALSAATQEALQTATSPPSTI